MSPLALSWIAAVSAQPQLSPAISQPQAWAPTAPYVTIGQDEQGYRNWSLAAPWHPAGVTAFTNYLSAAGVAGVVPTWQLIRTASDWQRCGAQPFEIPPTENWANIVQTLRFVRDKVVPAVGPVEPVSAYRNPALNACAGGAQESAHRYGQAIDLVPLNPITREDLIRRLCKLHAATGEPYGIGLGFYAFLRFHIDSRRFRNWGVAAVPEAAACAAEPKSPPLAQVPAAAVPMTVPPQPRPGG